MTEKKIIVASDLPGVGKVALAIAIPVLNSCCIETVALPTVLLSSHTGGFSQIAVLETGDFVLQALNQWRLLNLQTDALFVGYCRNATQLDHLLQYHLEHSPTQTLIVDPIMGDNGKLYTGFTSEYVSKMQLMAKHATIIMPNVTEATLLTQSPYPTSPKPIEYYEQLARKVAQYGSQIVLLTGVPHPSNDQIGVLSYQRDTDTITTVFTHKYPYHFYGTGDLFAALISAFYLHGYPIRQALTDTLHCIDSCLKDTLSSNQSLQYGLNIEKQLSNISHYFTSQGDFI